MSELERWRRHVETANGRESFGELAWNAFEVMMRRGWTAEPFEDGGWIVHFPGVDKEQRRGRIAADPFTALVEADKWMREHEVVEVAARQKGLTKEEEREIHDRVTEVVGNRLKSERLGGA